MTDAELAEIKARVEANQRAAEYALAPRCAICGSSGEPGLYAPSTPESEQMCQCRWCSVEWSIAEGRERAREQTSRQDAPMLVAEVERLRAEAEQLLVDKRALISRLAESNRKVEDIAIELCDAHRGRDGERERCARVVESLGGNYEDGMADYVIRQAARRIREGE